MYLCGDQSTDQIWELGYVHTWCQRMVTMYEFLLGTNVNKPVFQSLGTKEGNGMMTIYPVSEYSNILCCCLDTSAQAPSVNGNQPTKGHWKT